MGIFVNYFSNIYSNIANIPQTLVIADPNVVLITSLTVCNLGVEPIRFNLQKIRTEFPNPVTISYINEFEIKTYDTVDVIAEFGIQIYLQYFVTPPISDRLVCFSNGYTQKFDCEVTFQVLNELPF